MAKVDLKAADEQLKRNFSCKICFEPFSKNRRHPISLNCGHTFCARCIRQLSNLDTSISCGLCRRGTYSDFRQLGKNVTLLDLLENDNLLAEDDPNEETDEAETNGTLNQPWRGANHFVSSTALTAFLDRHADLRSSVHQFLSPSQWSEFDEPLDTIRCNLFTIEGQLRDAGDSFILQEGQLEQLEQQFQRMMTEYYHQQQQLQGPFSGFVSVRWAVSDDPDDDINVLAMSTRNIWEIDTSSNSPNGISDRPTVPSSFGSRRPWGLNGGTSDQPTSNLAALTRPWGCPPPLPRTRNLDKRRQRRSRKRTRSPYEGTVFNFSRGINGFDSWGAEGVDEWDQSAQIANNYHVEGMEAPQKAEEVKVDMEQNGGQHSRAIVEQNESGGHHSETLASVEETVDHHSETLASVEENGGHHHSEASVEPSCPDPPASTLNAEMVETLLDRVSEKDAFLLRKELNGILTKYEAVSIDK